METCTELGIFAATELQEERQVPSVDFSAKKVPSFAL